MLISVTRLRVRSLRFMPAFLWATFLAKRQAARSTGFLAGRVLADADRAFWTVTAWRSDAAMRGYRISSAHAKVMPKLQHWCDEASVAHWTAEGGELPSWPQVCEAMRRLGRPLRVLHPSPRHQTLGFPDPRLSPLISQDLKRTR